MPEINRLFVTKLYRAALDGSGDAALLSDLDGACRALAVDDVAGQRWCARNGYPGYTSYASLNDLPWRIPAFKTLAKRLDRHVGAFARELALDLGGGRLVLDSLWVNLLPPGGWHGAHLHPHSVVSGTLYVATPPGSGGLKFEDPRHAQMMAAPPRKAKAPAEDRCFVTLAPAAGDLILWESYLRHEVTPNLADAERISISFNHRWERG